MYIWKGGGGTRCHAGKRAGSRDTCLFYCVCKNKQKASPSSALAGFAQLTKRMLESDVPRVHLFIVSRLRDPSGHLAKASTVALASTMTSAGQCQCLWTRITSTMPLVCAGREVRFIEKNPIKSFAIRFCASSFNNQCNHSILSRTVIK